MTGHVRKRGSKWYAVISQRDEETGKRKRIWRPLENCEGKREAQAACIKLIAQSADGVSIKRTADTLAAFLDRWLAAKTNISPKTKERYGEIVNKNIKPLLGDVKLSKLTGEQISGAYVRALASGRADGKGGLSALSVVHMHRVLKGALKQAVRWNIINRNPADAADPPRVERKVVQTYDMQQTATLLDYTRGSRMFIPTLLAILCGLRRGEIAALTWGNVDFDTGYISVVANIEQLNKSTRVKDTKSGRARSVLMPQIVADELTAWRAEQAQELLRLGIRLDGDTFVVAREDGVPIAPRNLTQAWIRLRNKFVAEGVLPRRRLHDTRHAHATHMLANGVHPKIASERLGHSKIGITLDLYSHVVPGMQEGAAAGVDAALKLARGLGSKQR